MKKTIITIALAFIALNAFAIEIAYNEDGILTVTLTEEELANNEIFYITFYTENASIGDVERLIDGHLASDKNLEVTKSNTYSRVTNAAYAAVKCRGIIKVIKIRRPDPITNEDLPVPESSRPARKEINDK
jgi:hypothetical protein